MKLKKNQTTLDLFKTEDFEAYETMTLNTENIANDFSSDFLNKIDDIEVDKIKVDENQEELKSEVEKNQNEIDERLEKFQEQEVIKIKETQKEKVINGLGNIENYGKVNIMAIGVGGCGCNAINRMKEEEISGIKLVAIDTSRQTLESNKSDEKILVGESVLRGHGSGNDVEKASEAIKEAEERIRELLVGIDMVFITGGIGRGTGSAGLVEIGKIARELGILTIGFAILPGSIEADMKVVEQYYQLFMDAVDSNIIIENDKVNKVAADLPIAQARRVADEMLIGGIKGISDLITNPGKINLDYADIKTAFHNQGSCIMGIGYGQGENSVAKAIENSINAEIVNPSSIETAQTIVFNITCSKNTITIDEAAKGTELIYSKNSSHNIQHMLFGYSYDESLNERVKVTFIATGTKPIDFEEYKKVTSNKSSFFTSSGRGNDISGDIFSSIGDKKNDSPNKPDFFN